MYDLFLPENTAYKKSRLITESAPFIYACGKNMKYAKKMTSIPYMIG